MSEPYDKISLVYLISGTDPSAVWPSSVLTCLQSTVQSTTVVPATNIEK